MAILQGSMSVFLEIPVFWGWFLKILWSQRKAQPCRALLGYLFHNTAAHTEATPTREGI